MATPLEPEDDDFTELRDARIPRVDLVDKAANGLPFLIAKRADGAGLMDPGLVRDLIGKSGPEPATKTPAPSDGQVTMTGSPAAIIKLIHEAAQRSSVGEPAQSTYDYLVKAKYDTDDRKRMAANGQAMDDGSYPIVDREDLARAIRAVGRGGSGHDAIRRHIISRAKSLGASSEIPDTWGADGSLREGTVSKAMEPDETIPTLDPTVALAEPEGNAPGDPTAPGSPAWEAIDAATARKWTSILARAKHAVELLSEREMIEAASADPDDAFAAMDLDDACCAIDYAISVLAPFAVAEQAEADLAADEMAAVGKALAVFDPGPLDTIEALAHVRKAGRVLSSANESAIRGAVEQLQKVLASLPAAPTIPDGEAVTKESIVADTATPETPADDVAKTTTAADPVVHSPRQAMTESGAPVAPAPVVKEAPAPQVPVYDAHGRLIGVVAPENVVPVESAEDDTPDGEPAAEVEMEAAPMAADLEPAPAAEVGVPADDVAKTTTPDTPPTPSDTPTSDAESSIADVVKQRLDEYSATQEQALAKQAETITQLANTVDALTKKVQELEEQPATSGVFTNGATPQPQMRGQDAGTPAFDPSRAAELRKGLYQGPDAASQNAIATEMNGLAIAELARIHGSGPQ